MEGGDMIVFSCDCERCGQPNNCQFYGRASDPEKDAAQNGEWLCDECVPLRLAEMDAAIADFKRTLTSWKTKS
jgi:hypothetical protein